MATKARLNTSAPTVAPKSPKKYRARVRMYRHGLGDCFLLTLPRKTGRPLQILIDCGVLARNQAEMEGLVGHIRDSVRGDKTGKAAVDIVVGTHEHKDHISGFNQARQLFNDDFDFKSVWLAWTENLTQKESQKLKAAKKNAIAKLQGLAAMAQTGRLSLDSEVLRSVGSVLAFSQDEDGTPTGRVADAMEYLKQRGTAAGDLRFLEPGMAPFELPGLDVRVYVLGPPRQAKWLKTSAVTEAMKRDHVVYHLAASGDPGPDALAEALDANGGSDRFHPFAAEHRIAVSVVDAMSQQPRHNPYYETIRPFIEKNYHAPGQEWRRIDDDWLDEFGQLALNLDNDTNNTSLVLAFEFTKTREVLLFVADAQIGSWLSWAELEFEVPGSSKPVTAQDLLRRTVFYKVGHHCSHNATARNAGLELMEREDLVAFVPLDQATARSQGTKGWQMPAPPLFKALKTKSGERVVISDVAEPLPAAAAKAGVIATDTYIDYFLK